jgi:hypothetical protein
MHDKIQRVIAARYSVTKVRCRGCRNLVGLNGARILDCGAVCCEHCYGDEHRHVIPGTLTGGSVEIAG